MLFFYPSVAPLLAHHHQMNGPLDIFWVLVFFFFWYRFSYCTNFLFFNSWCLFTSGKSFYFFIFRQCYKQMTTKYFCLPVIDDCLQTVSHNITALQALTSKLLFYFCFEDSPHAKKKRNGKRHLFSGSGRLVDARSLLLSSSINLILIRERIWYIGTNKTQTLSSKKC